MSRIELINFILARNGYRSYLEIGCDSNQTFHAVNAPHKVGVDPNRGGTLRMTSDQFFAINREHFDLIFIDGLHWAEQVIRDVENSLKVLSPNGCILIHDCLPLLREHQERQIVTKTGDWTGDVWKAIVAIRSRSDCDTAVLNADWGLGIVLPRANTALLSRPPSELTWEVFESHSKSLLRVIGVDELEGFLRIGA
jgi:predicted O-methyltransferase YrrM